MAPSRRQVLRAAGVGAVGGLAGCSALAGGERETLTFCHLEILNEDTDPHTVHVRVDADGETVHDTDYEVPAANEESVGDRELDPQEFFDGTAHTLELWGSVDGGEQRGPAVWEAGDDGDGLVSPTYHVNEDATLDLLSSASAPECESETTQ